MPFLQDFREEPRVDVAFEQNAPEKQNQCEEVADAKAKIFLFFCMPPAR